MPHLQTLQNKLKAKGFKARSINGFIHSCLRAMLRDARIDGFITLDLFDRDFFKPLSITDSKPSIDPYKPEREIHLRDNVVRVLSEENLAPLNVSPDDFLFTTPEGTPIEQFL